MMKTAKFWAIMVTIIAVMAFAKWAHGAIYDSGYDAAELKWQTAQREAIEAAVKEARVAWDVTAEATVANIIIEEKIVERIKFVDRDVPRIVEKFVASECRDLGPDVQRVFNDAIRAAEGLPLPSDIAEPPEGVPGPDSG